MVYQDEIAIEQGKPAAAVKKSKAHQIKNRPTRRAEMAQARAVIRILDACGEGDEDVCPEELKEPFAVKWERNPLTGKIDWVGSSWRPAIYLAQKNGTNIRHVTLETK